MDPSEPRRRFLCIAPGAGPHGRCLWAGFADRCARCQAATLEVVAGGDVRTWYTCRVAQKPAFVRAAIVDWAAYDEHGAPSRERRREMRSALADGAASCRGVRRFVARAFVVLSA